jgi:hypothetical protein
MYPRTSGIESRYESWQSLLRGSQQGNHILCCLSNCRFGFFPCACTQICKQAPLSGVFAMRFSHVSWMMASLVLVTACALTSSATAGVPHDAGFKARGLKDAPRIMRTYRTPASANVVRESYSYVPAPAAPQAADNAAPPAPSPAPQRVVRSYSYQPAAPTVRMNVRRLEGTSRTHGGNYSQKALLY